MLYLLFFGFSFVLVSESGKIFGGRYARNGEFPFVVSIHGEGICAGSLVTLSKVVTAGHCLDSILIENTLNPYVVGGSVNLKKKNDGLEIRNVNSVLLNGKYKPRSRADGKIDSYDIGLAMLDYPFYPGKNLQVMNLVSWNATIFKNRWDEIVSKRTTCYAMGWGTTMYSFNSKKLDVEPIKPSSILKVIKVYPVERETCSKYFKPEEDLTMEDEICVYSVVETESICSGDSGGPLVCDGHVYALLSFSSTCGTNTWPQVYVFYWKYLDFLKLSATRFLISKLLIVFLLCLKFFQ